MEPVTSSPSDDMNWYMELCNNEMDGIIEVRLCLVGVKRGKIVNGKRKRKRKRVFPLFG